MNLKRKRRAVFAYALLFVSFAVNFAAQGVCTTVGEGCCFVTQMGATPTPDTVPGALAISSKGCLSLLQTNGEIFTYPINQTTCGLGPIALPVPFPASTTVPSGISYSPSGNCLLAFIDGPAGTVQPFSSSNCTLSSTGLIPFQGSGINSVAISSINGVTIARCSSPLIGTLLNCALEVEIANFSFKKVAYSPDGGCLAAIDCSMPTKILTYKVNANFTLTPVSTETLAGATDLEFSPMGDCLAVVRALPPDFLSRVTSYSFNPGDCSISSPQGVAGVGFRPTQLSFSPDGNCIAVATESSHITPIAEGILEIYSVDSTNCSLALVQHCTPNATTELGRSVAGRLMEIAYILLRVPIFMLIRVIRCHLLHRSRRLPAFAVAVRLH